LAEDEGLGYSRLVLERHRLGGRSAIELESAGEPSFALPTLACA